MNGHNAQLLASPVARLAIPMDAGFIRAMIPAGTVGAYLLLDADLPIYVGRSDRCLLSRLVQHELARVASHVVFSPCRKPEHAFSIEAEWYHRLMGLHRSLNIIHPARPAGSRLACPFCISGEELAISYALGRAA